MALVVVAADANLQTRSAKWPASIDRWCLAYHVRQAGQRIHSTGQAAASVVLACYFELRLTTTHTYLYHSTPTPRIRCNIPPTRCAYVRSRRSGWLAA